MARWADLFDEIVQDDAAIACRLAHAFETRIPHFWREVGHRELPDAGRLRPLVDALRAERLHPSGTPWVLDRLLREDGDADTIVREHLLAGEEVIATRAADWLANRRKNIEHARQTIGELLDTSYMTSPIYPFATTDIFLQHAMGKILKGHPRGSFDPQRVRDMLTQRLAEADG